MRYWELKKVVEEIEGSITGRLEHEGLKGAVQGREKHLYSIYRKMAESKRPLSDIVDVYGFRVIVNDVNTCYRLLGVVHGLFKPMPARFGQPGHFA